MNKYTQFLKNAQQKFKITNVILKNDKNSIMNLVQKDGFNLQFAPNQLKNDKDIVMASVKNCGVALAYASDKLKNNKEIVMVAVEQNGQALKHASTQLKNDKKIVLEAVKNDGASIQWASDRLKNDKEISLYSLNNIFYIGNSIYNLFGENIKKLINGITNIEDAKSTLKVAIGKEELNKNITPSTKINKLRKL